MSPTSGPHSYRDFIDPDLPMYRSDLEILEYLEDRTHVSPHQLAEGRYRENVIRLQLRDLEQVGILNQIGLETYRLSQKGRQFLNDPPEEYLENDLLNTEKYLPSAFPSADWRLQDFSAIDAKVLKGLNCEFHQQSGVVYGDVRRDNQELTLRRIANVSDSNIHRIIREFPTSAPLPEACAHWMRSIVGLHLFPDANHRTATNSLEYLVEQADGPSDRIIAQHITRYVLHSKYARTFQADIRFNTLWAKDELYSVWYRYFTRALCSGLEVRRPHDPSTEKLDNILEDARESLQGLDT